MKTQKRLALLFPTLVFLAFNAIFFLLGGSDLSSVWITYGVMCASFIADVTLNAVYAKSERSFGIMHCCFAFNVILCAIVSLIKPNGNTGIIIAEIVLCVIWLVLIFAFTSANQHTVSSSKTQVSSVDGVRTQANRIMSLTGRYMNGKLDQKLETAYDDIRLLPASSVAKSGLISRLEFAVTELENAMKNENVSETDEAFNQLYDIIARIKNI
jgi:hypothetical protein